MAKKLYYKIGEACKLLDIQPYVLRYWETEFPFLNPSKSKSGQRVYGQEELVIIRRIKELLYDEGYTIAGAKKKLEAESGGDGASPGSGKAESGTSGTAASGNAASGTVTSGTVAPRAAPAPPRPADSPPKSAATTTKQLPFVPPAKAAPTPETVADRPPAASPASAARLQQLRSGLERVLSEARSLLDFLDRQNAGGRQRS